MGKISREAQINKNKYRRKYIKVYDFYFECNDDKDVVDKIKAEDNKTEYIRSLIRNDSEIFEGYAYHKGKQTTFPSKENRVRISINISRKSAQDVIDKLDSVKNKNWYIRDLVLNDLKNEK
jgi:hypothetical protein